MELLREKYELLWKLISELEIKSGDVAKYATGSVLVVGLIYLG